MIVGLAAMHSGWFPAFAVALITLLVGILIGFPPEALAMLCGFAAATGPAFADMGYDLKAGWILRGNGKNPAFELDGRRQQFLAASMAFLIAIPVVAFVYQDFFSQGLVPPVAKVYIAAIQAGVSFDIAKSLLIWAIPGASFSLSAARLVNGRAARHWPSYQQSDGWLGRFDWSRHSHRCA